MELGAKIAEIDSEEENNFLKEIAINLSGGKWITRSIYWKKYCKPTCARSLMKLKYALINHVPTRIYIPISQYPSIHPKMITENLFLMSIFVANYGNTITLHFHFCDDLESRFYLHELINKSTFNKATLFNYNSKWNVKENSHVQLIS